MLTNNVAELVILCKLYGRLCNSLGQRIFLKAYFIYRSKPFGEW